MKYMFVLGVASALAFTSCTSVRVEREDVNSGSPICVTARGDGQNTKAMLDGDSFCHFANALQIWDVYMGDSPVAYIDGKYVVSDGGGAGAVWPFRKGIDIDSDIEKYYWTKAGAHRFYGVLVNDKSVDPALSPATLWGDSCGFGKAGAPHVFAVPQTEMNLDSPQFDFVYSNVVERNLDTSAGTDISDGTDVKRPVGLTFKHLFSAFAFTLKNESAGDLKLKDVSLQIQSGGEAGIDYSGAWTRDADISGCPSVTYTLSNVSDIKGVADGVTVKILPANAKVDLFNHVGSVVGTASDKGEFKLAWPQSLEGKTLKFSYTVTESVGHIGYVYNGRGSGYSVVSPPTSNPGKGEYDYVSGNHAHYVYNPDHKGNFDVTFKEDPNGDYSKTTYYKDEERDIDKSFSLDAITPDSRWEAGKRYLYNLSYSNTVIDLKVTVMQWNGGHGGGVEFN